MLLSFLSFSDFFLSLAAFLSSFLDFFFFLAFLSELEELFVPLCWALLPPWPAADLAELASLSDKAWPPLFGLVSICSS